MTRTSSLPAEVQAAYKRVYIGRILVIIVMVAVIIAGVIGFTIAIEDPCDHYHRIAVVTDDGPLRYIQGEYQYLSLDEIGMPADLYIPGDEVRLCFDSITDEFIRICPYNPNPEEQNAAMMKSLVIALIVPICFIIVFVLICQYTPFGNAYYDYLKAERKKEKEQLPFKVRLVIGAVSVALALLICMPLITDLIGNIQRSQRIQERSDIIHGAADAADDLAEDMKNIEDALESTGINEAAEKASEAAGNIWDILDKLNGTDSTEDAT